MGFFDLQVNGYGGVDFNQDGLTADAIHTACQKLRDDGVEGILATIITEDLPKMAARLRRLVELRERDELTRDMIRGFHIEGPFLSPLEGYRGAHPADAIRPASVESIKPLLDACAGLARLVTLAPECDPGLRVTRYMSDHGVVVAAGHCNASRDQLCSAIDAGLSMFTHLGNGCPMTLPRHDNIIQRALSLSDRLWLCFIADGVHVPFYALRNYLEAATLGRCIIATDAIAPAGLGPGRYTLGRWHLDIGEDLVARAHDGGHLVGSATSMPRAADNLRRFLQLTEVQIDQLTRRNPIQAMT